MHNGQIGGYNGIRRRLESHISDTVYAHRQGTTDTETLFMIAQSLGLADDPLHAMEATLSIAYGEMKEAGIEAPLRFTAALTDGKTIWAYRWASDNDPATLYFERTPDGLVIASEPFNDNRDQWIRVPPGHALVARPGESVDMPAMKVA